MVRAWRVRRLHAMYLDAEPRAPAQGAVVLVGDLRHVEDVVRAELDAVDFALAFTVIYDRRVCAGRSLALSPGGGRGSAAARRTLVASVRLLWPSSIVVIWTNPAPVGVHRGISSGLRYAYVHDIRPVSTPVL